VRVGTLRRDPIDYDALARAALEQAAMNQAQDQERDTDAPAMNDTPKDPELRPQHRPHASNRSKEPRHDRLA
jgi:sRNA-binding protein